MLVILARLEWHGLLARNLHELVAQQLAALRSRTSASCRSNSPLCQWKRATSCGTAFDPR